MQIQQFPLIIHVYGNDEQFKSKSIIKDNYLFECINVANTFPAMLGANVGTLRILSRSSAVFPLSTLALSFLGSCLCICCLLVLLFLLIFNSGFKNAGLLLHDVRKTRLSKINASILFAICKYIICSNECLKFAPRRKIYKNPRMMAICILVIVVPNLVKCKKLLRKIFSAQFCSIAFEHIQFLLVSLINK
jgi:hypothetical protein